MIRVASTGSATVDALDPLRAEFSSSQMVRLPGFLSRDFVGYLQLEIQHAVFVDRVHEGIGQDQHMLPNPALSLIHFALNAPELISAVEEISGHQTLGGFLGHVFRLTPGNGYDSWHTDADGQRQIGLTVNLGAEPYEGGVFQLKDLASQRLLGEVANVIPGDAVLFRIDKQLAHRATAVTSTVPRLTLAGWFHSGASFWSMLAEGGWP
jgi:2OG-Fe(II) oxygenase superfamily